jgi:hypothetical protein
MAEITEYEPIPNRIRVLFWPQASAEDLGGLFGAENISVLPDTRVQARNSAQEWVTLGPNWAVTVDADGNRHIISPRALEDAYRLV